MYQMVETNWDIADNCCGFVRQVLHTMLRRSVTQSVGSEYVFLKNVRESLSAGFNSDGNLSHHDPPPTPQSESRNLTTGGLRDTRIPSPFSCRSALGPGCASRIDADSPEHWAAEALTSKTRTSVPRVSCAWCWRPANSCVHKDTSKAEARISSEDPCPTFVAWRDPSCRFQAGSWERDSGICLCVVPKLVILRLFHGMHTSEDSILKIVCPVFLSPTPTTIFFTPGFWSQNAVPVR